jgi:putative serine protease PepD
MNPDVQEDAPPMRRIILIIAAGLTLVASLSACSGGTAEESAKADPGPKKLTRAELVARVRPSIAKVFARNPLGEGSGTAITIDAEKGLLLTNRHVVAGAAETQVKYSGGTKISAKVIGSSMSPDLAVLKLDHVPPGLKAVPFAQGGEKVGDPVVAVGFAGSIRRWNTAQARASFGFIDDMNMRGTDLGPDTCPQGKLMMTGAAINHGMSGGAMFNEQGEVIAVITYTDSESDQGYGIQADVVRQVLPGLIAGKKGDGGLYTIPVRTLDMTNVASIFFGDALSASDIRYLGRVYQRMGGLFVVSATAGSSADRKGFEFGDVIYYMNDVEVNTATQQCRVTDSSDVLKLKGWSMSEGPLPSAHSYTRRVHVK